MAKCRSEIRERPKPSSIPAVSLFAVQQVSGPPRDRRQMARGITLGRFSPTTKFDVQFATVTLGDTRQNRSTGREISLIRNRLLPSE